MVKKKKGTKKQGQMIGFSMAKFLDMADQSGLITVAEAAALRGVSQVSITHLINRGRLTAHEVFGRKMLFRHEVENFERGKPGPQPERKGSTKEN